MKERMLLIGILMNMHAAGLTINSLDFSANQPIPKEFTCEGANKAPKLVWENVPQKTKSFAIICDDPDAPAGTWVHWVVYNIPADKRSLDYITDRTEKLSDGTMQGANSWPKIGYDGPCPPKGHGIHHYHFKLFALDSLLNLKPKATKEELLKAMKGHIVAQAEITGLYERK